MTDDRSHRSGGDSCAVALQALRYIGALDPRSTQRKRTLAEGSGCRAASRTPWRYP